MHINFSILPFELTGNILVTVLERFKETGVEEEKFEETLPHALEIDKEMSTVYKEEIILAKIVF